MISVDDLQEVPTYTGNNWVKYKEAFFFLLDEKNYPPKKAVRIIAEKESLSSHDEALLYNSSKQWKRNTRSASSR